MDRIAWPSEKLEDVA